MIISDMHYQYNAVESNDVEGGQFDLGSAMSFFTGDYSILATGSTSGPGGSITQQYASHANVNTGSQTVVGLDLLGLIVGPGTIVAS